MIVDSCFLIAARAPRCWGQAPALSSTSRYSRIDSRRSGRFELLGPVPARRRLRNWQQNSGATLQSRCLRFLALLGQQLG